METLLTTHMDTAMELFQSWCYRNAFTVGVFGGVVVVRLKALFTVCLFLWGIVR